LRIKRFAFRKRHVYEARWRVAVTGKITLFR
jgi:hypothetical protein